MRLENKRYFPFLLIGLLLSASLCTAQERTMQLNLQAHGNFSELLYGKNSSLVCNLPMSTFTLEGTGSDRIGSTYFFIDLEVGNFNQLVHMGWG